MIITWFDRILLQLLVLLSFDTQRTIRLRIIRVLNLYVRKRSLFLNISDEIAIFLLLRCFHLNCVYYVPMKNFCIFRCLVSSAEYFIPIVLIPIEFLNQKSKRRMCSSFTYFILQCFLFILNTITHTRPDEK